MNVVKLKNEVILMVVDSIVVMMVIRFIYMCGWLCRCVIV